MENTKIDENEIWQDGYDAGYMQGLRSGFRLTSRKIHGKKAKADNLAKD